jgi:hypothetical protein
MTHHAILANTCLSCFAAAERNRLTLAARHKADAVSLHLHCHSIIAASPSKHVNSGPDKLLRSPVPRLAKAAFNAPKLTASAGSLFQRPSLQPVFYLSSMLLSQARQPSLMRHLAAAGLWLHLWSDHVMSIGIVLLLESAPRAVNCLAEFTFECARHW